jgi:hypothetical protein
MTRGQELYVQEQSLQLAIADLQPLAKFRGDQEPWDGLTTNTHRTKPFPGVVVSPDGRDYAATVAEIQSLQLLVADLRLRVSALEPAKEEPPKEE